MYALFSPHLESQKRLEIAPLPFNGRERAHRALLARGLARSRDNTYRRRRRFSSGPVGFVSKLNIIIIRGAPPPLTGKRDVKIVFQFKVSGRARDSRRVRRRRRVRIACGGYAVMNACGNLARG